MRYLLAMILTLFVTISFNTAFASDNEDKESVRQTIAEAYNDNQQLADQERAESEAHVHRQVAPLDNGDNN